jgi:hypothetical protein
MCTMLYKLFRKGCTNNWKRFNLKVVRNLLQHCSIHCTTNYELLLNIEQYVQYCTKPCTTLFSNQFFNCTIFQLVMHVQPFVQCCTICVQYCAILYRLYRLYNLLYNIVTVWFADEPARESRRTVPGLSLWLRACGQCLVSACFWLGNLNGAGRCLLQDGSSTWSPGHWHWHVTGLRVILSQVGISGSFGYAWSATAPGRGLSRAGPESHECSTSFSNVV